MAKQYDKKECIGRTEKGRVLAYPTRYANGTPYLHRNNPPRTLTPINGGSFVFLSVGQAALSDDELAEFNVIVAKAEVAKAEEAKAEEAKAEEAKAEEAKPKAGKGKAQESPPK